MPLILLDDVGAGGVVGDLRARGFGIGIEAIAPPILDLGFFFALTLPDFRRVSNLLAKKLAVLAKILMSPAACPLCQGSCPLLYFSLFFRWAG